MNFVMDERFFKYARPQIFNLAGNDEFAHGACSPLGSKVSGNCGVGNSPTTGYCKNGNNAQCLTQTSNSCRNGPSNSYFCSTGEGAADKCCQTGTAAVACYGGSSPTYANGCGAGNSPS